MKNINTKLSVNGCWEMVNGIQSGRTAAEIRERCYIAEQWLIVNEVITNEEFDDLMRTVAYLHRESSRIE